MAYKVVETDAVRDELVRTLDYLDFVLFEPSFAKKLAGAYLEFLGNKASLLGYVALYLVKGDTVAVVHLFHQSQDYAQLV